MLIFYSTSYEAVWDKQWYIDVKEYVDRTMARTRNATKETEAKFKKDWMFLHLEVNRLKLGLCLTN
jgi:hypothetical protein